MTAQDADFYQRIFEATPAKLLVLRPHSFEILAATNDYCRATNTDAQTLIGEPLFNAFPDKPDDPVADGVYNLSKSLQRVMDLKIPDTMGIQRYPVPMPDGTFEEQYWSPVNTPVLDDQGAVQYIIHRVEDVTELVQEGQIFIESPSAGAPRNDAVQEFILRANELKETLNKLYEHEARMRSAEQTLDMGSWELDLTTNRFHWSKPVFDLFKKSDRDPAPTLSEYFALIHPADQAAVQERFQQFIDEQRAQFVFEHRILTLDGQTQYVKGVGERHRSAAGERILGFVQNITPMITIRHQLSQAERMLRLAGSVANLGAWRVELATNTVTWTSETAAIHGLPYHFSPPTTAQGLAFYTSEFRPLIEAAFYACAEQGKPFDIICQLDLPNGNHPWVRVIGTAERDHAGNILAVQGALQDITQLQEAQRQADQKERERLNILESIGDAFFALDKDWNFTYLNQHAYLVLDRIDDDLLGKNIWTEFPAAIGSPFEEHYTQARESLTTRHFQAHYPPLNKWFDVSAYPIPDGLAVYFRDITDERKRQDQLRLVDAALSRLNDIVIITEAYPIDQPDGPRIIYVNDAFTKLTGYSREQAMGKTPRMLQGKDTDPNTRRAIRQALQLQRPIRCELLNYNQNGRSYWIEIDITPLFNAQGICTHFVAVERDITQRKKSDLKLKQAQERYQLISRATNDVIWDWDLIKNHILWNDSVTDVFGYHTDDLGTHPNSWIQRLHPKDRDDVLQSTFAVLQGSDDVWRGEYRFLKSDGHYAQVIDRCFVLRDKQGKAIRMVGSMLDITDRKDMENQLRESQKLEAVGHLTGGVAHDFNNLLTVIVGNAEILVDELKDPRLTPMAELMLSAAQRGAELTSRLLAYARRRPLEPTITNINQLIEGMRPLIRRTLPEHIELKTRLANNLGLTEIDASELDTALLNLVVNARDAMSEGGSLLIETANVQVDESSIGPYDDWLPGAYVLVSVSDTGSGMSQEIIQRATEPLYTTKPVGKGSGLGLSMVFGFTKQSGGHIKIESELGTGTTIHLYFPQCPQTADQLPDTVQDVALPERGHEHILVAEDDELVLQSLTAQLVSLGYRVSTAYNGHTALEALQTHTDIALLLTDIIMPGGINGRELAERAQALYPNLKVLFTSGYTDNALIQQGRLAPGVELLNKPYTRLELATKLREALRGKPH